jgi:hypothetical protein
MSAWTGNAPDSTKSRLMLTSNTVNADTTSCRKRLAWATAMCSLCSLALLLPGVAQADEQPSPNVVAPSAASVATVSQDLDQAVDAQNAPAATASEPSNGASGQVVVASADDASGTPAALQALTATTDDGIAVGPSTDADTSDVTLTLPVRGPQRRQRDLPGHPSGQRDRRAIDPERHARRRAYR